ncbi:MAG: TetR/AcrR family transcriptional regulator [Proteobacteria bacterium]|nr:TetR/AcrR family transcriptional regulator [Pseudomonadota bacterium]
MKKAASHPRRSKDEVKHEAILKAATRLFLKHGYSATSMDAIAESARVTKQTVYAHYKSKDALFEHILSHLCEKHTASEQLLALSNRNMEEGLFAIGLAFLNMVTHSEVLAMTRLVISESGQHPKLAKRYYDGGTQRIVSLLAELLGHYKKRGQLNVADTNSAASYFIAMLKGQYYIRMILGIKPTPAPRDKELHVRESVRVFMKVYADANPLQTRSSL